MKSLWYVEDQRFPFEVPGSGRVVQGGGKKWREYDYTAHLEPVGSVEASSAKEAIMLAKEHGLSRFPVVYPELPMDELQELLSMNVNEEV